MDEGDMIGDPKMMELPDGHVMAMQPLVIDGHMMAMQPLVIDGRNVIRISTTAGPYRDLTMVELADLMRDMATDFCEAEGDTEGARKLREAADHMLNDPE